MDQNNDLIYDKYKFHLFKRLLTDTIIYARMKPN